VKHRARRLNGISASTRRLVERIISGLDRPRRRRIDPQLLKGGDRGR
jgi:hypothetical protein